MTDRSWRSIWTQRVIVIPVFFAALALVLALSPVLFPVCAVVDIVRKSSWAAVRCAAFLVLYLVAETLGVLLAALIWIFSGRCVGLGKKRFLDWSFTLQRAWGCLLFHGFFFIFSMKIDIDEPEGMDEGPLMLFARHASLPDASLPGALFMLRHNIRIRHIIKKELLWDPCLNIFGNRLPHCFVRRESSNTDRELDKIRELTAGMGRRDGIMIFPEGTRFSPKKRETILGQLAEKGDAFFLEKARALKNVLPPRLGGSLAILEANTKACAVFCAHAGFEAARKAMNLLNGALIRQTVRVKLWKVPFAMIPTTREARIEWLFDHWRKVDEWVELMQSEELPVAENLSKA